MPASRWVTAACILLLLRGVSSAFEIEIEAVDAKGAPVAGLTVADLQIDFGKEASVGTLRYVEGLSETKIYVGAEMPATDFALIEGALQRMIENLPPGVQVSLAGAPFTSDKAQLREYLALGFELPRKIPDSGLVKIWDFGQGYRIQGRPIVDNYTLLASQLAATPGQKRVILYRLSLELRQDGLDTRDMNIRTGQLRQNDADMLRNEESVEKLGTVAALARARFYTTNASVNANAMDDHGLNAVSRHTGGQALLGVGNPYDVIETALGDLRGYYVATVDLAFEGKGSRRNLKASANRKGVDVKLPRPFLLDLPGLGMASGGVENLLAKGPAESTLQIRSEHWVFRGPGAEPIVLVSAGAPASALETSDADKGVAVELSLAGGFQSGGAWSAAAQRTTLQVFEKKAFANARKRGDVWLDVNASGALPGAGMHPWKAVLRNSAGGAVGVVEQQVGVRDLSRPLSTSDVLITRRAIPVKPDTPAEPWGDLLDFGGSRLIPESTREFDVGEPVLFTYRLYNAPREMIDNPPPVQLALFKDEVQLESFDGQGESRVIEGQSEIQYIGSLQTKGLEPGEYLILSAVPGRDDERHPYVEGSFRLVKK